jgi:hypothetical protein
MAAAAHMPIKNDEEDEEESEGEDAANGDDSASVAVADSSMQQKCWGIFLPPQRRWIRLQ